MRARSAVASWIVPIAIALVPAPAVHGQTGRTSLKPMLDRLASEAASFEKLAQEVTGEETIRQRAMKPPPKFRPRIGEAATKAPAPQWREREIISLYGIALIGHSLHEIRQVLSVDGKTVQGEQHAQQTLTELLTTSGDQQKFAALKQLEKYTLNGAATDFGPLLLLFAHGGAERYEFTALGPRLLGAVPASAYHFKQLDGSEGLTLFAGATQKLRIEGEIWISEAPEGPIRITLSSTVPDSAPLIREEATVDYARSPLGALLPSAIEQRELHGEEVAAEHLFDYANFQRLANR